MKITESTVFFVILTRTGAPLSRHNALGKIPVPFGLFLLKSDRPQAFTGKRCGLESSKDGKRAKKRDPANTESLLLKASG